MPKVYDQAIDQHRAVSALSRVLDAQTIQVSVGEELYPTGSGPLPNGERLQQAVCRLHELFAK